MKVLTALHWIGWLVVWTQEASAAVVLNKKIVELAQLSAKLSALAYEEDPPGDEYDDFGFYDDEPDQALSVYMEGYCIGAFRGTTLTWNDWEQNLRPGKQDICVTDEKTGETDCCTTREGFFEAYDTHYRADLEASLRQCAKRCLDPDECVVLTGHSQGGAIAAVAGVYLADLNPYVITFGQPPTIDQPCPRITSERWFRFINTKSSHTVGITYDPVPFAPGLGVESFGHMILLGDDDTSVAYMGLDVQDQFGPLNTLGFEAHSMIAAEGGEYPGYLDRLVTLTNHTNMTYPIPTEGYKAGTLCSQGRECLSGVCERETGFSWYRCVGVQCTQDADCPLTGRCDSGQCIPKLGSCRSCDEDSDCAGDSCYMFHCTSPGTNLMDDNCFCVVNQDCVSGRCEGVSTRQCEAQLGLGGRCNEDSDCKSNFCAWNFRCEDPMRVTSKTGGLSRGGIVGIIVAVIVVVGAAAAAVNKYMEDQRSRGYEEVPPVEETKEETSA